VGDLFPCRPEGARSRLLKLGGTLTVIEATDERTLRQMLTGSAYDLFPVWVDDIVAKGDVVQRLAALRAHVALVEKDEAVRFGVDVRRLREQVQQISKLTGPDGWRDEDAGILGVDAARTESLKRSGAFARAADILAEAEASLGGHHVRTGGTQDCSPLVEQLRDAVYALRAAPRHLLSPEFSHHVEAALRFAEGANGLALLAGADIALVPDSWVETFTAKPTASPVAAARRVPGPASLDAALKELEATLCGKYPTQEAQQLLLRRRVLGARLLCWVLEHALSTSLPPRGAAGAGGASRPGALDMMFCSGEAPDVLQPDVFPYPFPRAEGKSEEVKAAFLKLCRARPRPFLCMSVDSNAGCDLFAVGASPGCPAARVTLAALALFSVLAAFAVSADLAKLAASATLAAFAALAAFAMLTAFATPPKRPVVLVEVKDRGAVAAAEWRKKEDLVAAEETEPTAKGPKAGCSLVNDVELRTKFDFTLVLAGRQRLHCGDV
jgi:hypothetical protein